MQLVETVPSNYPIEFCILWENIQRFLKPMNRIKYLMHIGYNKWFRKFTSDYSAMLKKQINKKEQKILKSVDRRVFSFQFLL